MSVSDVKQQLREILSMRTESRRWSDMDEVYPGIFIGGAEAAKNTEELRKVGVTHIVNSSYSSKVNYTALGVSTNEDYYKDRDLKCKFLGLPANDISDFPISQYFDQSSEFIHSALQKKEKVLVHCFMGVSRSATLVLAYLMIKQKMTAPDALRLVRTKRPIYPNDGFLNQLCDLQTKLRGK